MGPADCESSDVHGFNTTFIAALKIKEYFM